MGSTDCRRKNVPTNRRSPLSEPEYSSNPVGIPSENNESAQTPFPNPDFVANNLDVEPLSAVEKDGNENLETQRQKNQERTAVILKKLNAMNLMKYKEYVPDNKDVTLLSLANEILDLEDQIDERKKWAIEKEMQVAKKLCDDIKELKTLIMERDTTQRILQKNMTLVNDDSRFESLVDVETDLRVARYQIECRDLIVRQIEEENKKNKADMAALKMSTSESVKRCREAAKMEKKHLREYSGWEKQRDKLHEDITSERKKLLELQEEMVQVEEAKKTAEAKWRKEQEAKKDALTRVKQEKRVKEETISNNNQILEALQAKKGLDCKRHKEDIQRLEQELARVKSWSDPDHDVTSRFGPYFEDDDAIAKAFHGTSDEFDKNDDRECVICKNDEVSVVFLPCAHQVLCGGCNEEMEKKGEDKCPACWVLIEQRIHVYGAS